MAHPLVPRSSPRARLATLALVAGMVLAVAGVWLLAWLDEARESAAALDDFAVEQAALAASIAADLGTRLALAQRDQEPPPSPSQLLAGLQRQGRPHESVLLVQPPGAAELEDTGGQRAPAPALLRALAEGRSWVRLERPEAAALGLPARMAIAGLATVDAGRSGRWAVAVVTSALRERDRQRRASSRLLLSVLLSAGLVGVFGGLGLWRQRRELRLEQQLSLAALAQGREERLDRLDKAATMLTLASGVAHELGTPLGVIVGRAEQLLSRAGGDERSERALRAILDQASHIHQVVRGFLELARGARPALQLVPPRDVVTTALGLVEHRFAQAGVLLEAELPEGLPDVSCEPRLLEHALVNLLLNACDASPKGSLVRVRVEQRASALAFTVIDAGPGIPEAHAARATEPFFTTKPLGKGTGLGLAIVAEIAKSHRGTLHLAQASPTGTRASVEIPLAEVAHG